VVYPPACWRSHCQWSPAFARTVLQLQEAADSRRTAWSGQFRADGFVSPFQRAWSDSQAGQGFAAGQEDYRHQDATM